MLKQAAFFGIVLGMAGGIPAMYQSHKTQIQAILGYDSSPKAQTVSVATNNGLRVKHDVGRVVRIPMDARGHFNANFKMNGRRVHALIDTGATLIAINRSTARRIGLKVKPTDFKYEVDTANGKTKAAAGYIDEVAVGKIRVKNVPALIMNDKALSGTLLGMSFLKELDSFQVADRELVLKQ